MAAPYNTIWGNSIVGDKSTRQGQIGISATQTNAQTSVSVKVQVWFRSMYSLQDSNNSYYYNAASSATTLIGAKTINHTANSGGAWSESNQTLLGEYSYTYNKTTSVQKKYFSAKFTGLDNLGESNVTSVTISIDIPTLLPLTITYNANGGSGAPGNQIKYWGISTSLSNTKPTRTGYTFQNWNTKSDGTGTSYAPGASYTGNTELMLYAIWKVITYTITYNGNGGTVNTGTQTKNHGSSVPISGTATRDKYNFKGWSTSVGGSVIYKTGDAYSYNANTTLYAVWELAYTKPRIWGVIANRCDENGLDDDSGEYAWITFSWAADYNISGASVKWTSESASGDTDPSFSVTGTTGTVSKKLIGIFGSSKFEIDSTYSIEVDVYDGEEHSYAYTTLPGVSFPIDVIEDSGIAFGKPAELEGVADFGWKARFYNGIMPMKLPDRNLNNIFDPNFYISENAASAEYENCPVTAGTFTLVVYSGGEHGQVRQELISCDMYRPRRFVRFYHSMSTGSQGWGEWMNGGTEEVVLYDNPTGIPINTTGDSNVSLPTVSDISIFEYIEIYYTDNNGLKGGYVKIQHPAVGDYICLSITESAGNNTVYFRQSKYQITTTSTDGPDITIISYISGGYLQYISGSGLKNSESTSANYIKIKKIVGRA